MLIPPEKVASLNPAFSAILIGIANKLSFDLFITEAVPAHKEGSHVENSAHFKGLAVDLRVGNGWERYSIIKAALEAGIKRIGVYDRHVHLDADPALPQPVIWAGTSK